MKTKVNIEWNEDSKIVEVEATESDIFKAIGEVLLEISAPNRLYVSTNYGDAEFSVGKRGTFVDDEKVTHPSMYVTENFNYIRGLASSKYPDIYLGCLNRFSNNYKFYLMQQLPSGEIDATYGRIGAEVGEMFAPKKLQTPYPSYMYWIRVYEKMSKGYEDYTEAFLSKKKCIKKSKAKASTDKDIKSNPVSAELYAKLRAFAKHMVQETLTSSDITIGQVQAAKKYWKALNNRKTVRGFNSQLKHLLIVSPRKARYISELFATSEADFAEIVDREETLIAAMEAMLSDEPVVNTKLQESFERMGIEVYEATDKQKEEVLNKLSDQLKSKVKKIYRVINREHKKRFDNYLAKTGIKTVKQLWHGSRNQNWFSIIKNGLELNPNAIITGKMFGQGIYFAPSSMKSWNYTSYRGTSWARGTSDVGIMGLYATAYGQPHDVTCAQKFTQKMLDSLGKNCIHAHAGSQLLNDEIVYYDEAAMVLNYIVEFE